MSVKEFTGTATERTIGDTVAEFDYNADGIRTYMFTPNATHYYTVDGNRILEEKIIDSDNAFHYFIYIYDETGAPIGIKYSTDNTTFSYYFFEKNLQGDIVGIFNDEGTRVGTYTYDAWGNVTHNVSWFMASHTWIVENNPFRYRGYYYDVETGWYYLQTRYYNPETGRFLSVDRLDVILASPFGLTDKNLYAYCDNNPITRKDDGGAFWETLFDVVSLVASVVDVFQNPSDPWAWAGLAGDALDLVPFVSGLGETTRAVRVTNGIVDAADTAYDVAKTADNIVDGSIDTYKNLKKVYKGSGLEVHHIVEKRFHKVLGVNPSEMLSIALEPKEHRVFTNAWRQAIPYGETPTIPKIWDKAQEIYANYPRLLEAARKTIWGK